METATRSAGRTTGTMAPATQLVAGDRIAATLVAGNGAKRLNVAYTFNHRGEQVDQAGNTLGGPALRLPQNGGTAEPVFPLEQYRALIQQNSKAEADQLSVEYKKQYDAFRQGGGGGVAEGIRRSVLAFIRDQHKIPATGGGEWNLDENQIGVIAPVRREAGEPGVWLIQATPVWGF